MKLHEFQAKELIERYGIAIPGGRIATSPEEAGRVARRLGFDRFVVKAQVRSTDRRAAGGVRFAASPEGVEATAELLLGQTLPDPSGGASFEPARFVLVEEAVAPLRLLYAAVVLDRNAERLTLLACRIGGEGIEARIRLEPDLLMREPIAFSDAVPSADFLGLARRIELHGEAATRVAGVFENMARLAAGIDATQVEINPLAVATDGRVVALDAKVVIDDNALFRHPALAAFRDAVEADDGDPQELAADRHHLNYAAMDGDIGIVSNGAGLALATLDMLIEAGGRPANFMDIRTTATSLDIAYGLELVLSNPSVKAVLVNVHGGGMQRCDTIAEGLAVAYGRAGRRLPLVVRMAGNNAEFAWVRLQASGIPVIAAADMEDAAGRAVAAARAGT